MRLVGTVVLGAGALVAVLGLLLLVLPGPGLVVLSLAVPLLVAGALLRAAGGRRRPPGR
ncbi:hypothetical protein [Pseudokineococcus lusitanus]|uniref:Uncharacterized protein n=1 Tax=Pseudokineococcus lusitanus TaxID=763993 RepID=A0A3N1HRC6_9ACTN|nr:hypothetical protein [Pseudokineococcus lusitanus]ROP45051.1 hypothetical protein EDC03_1181 [Pseudokineococcus lusitanus]